MIKCGTHRGFRTSLGRGDPCTRYQSRIIEHAIPLSGRKKIRFPFPRGKGLGVRFFALARDPDHAGMRALFPGNCVIVARLSARGD